MDTMLAAQSHWVALEYPNHLPRRRTNIIADEWQIVNRLILSLTGFGCGGGVRG